MRRKWTSPGGEPNFGSRDPTPLSRRGFMGIKTFLRDELLEIIEWQDRPR
jgi:hypothetical protein